MDADDLALFRASLQHATASHTGKALDDALEELGWREALADDRRAAVSALFELQGAANTTSSALDAVVAGALGVEAGVVLPPLGSSDPPGHVVDGRLTAHGLGTFALADRRSAVVACEQCFVSIDTSDLAVRPIGGVDPALGLVEVTADGTPAAAQEAAEPSTWAAAVAAGQLAVAHELVGAARTMLQLARDHAVERIQFGRPIATFQAVRHRLAESLVALEAAEAALGAAWAAGSTLDAAVAKAIAGRSARTVARHAQQVLAGIGFTTEHAFHRYLRRVLVLERLFGDTRSLTEHLGEELVRARRLPSPLPL